MLNISDLKDYSLLIIVFFYSVLLPGYLLTRVLLQPIQLRELLKFFPKIEGSLAYRYFYYLFAPAAGLILVDALVLILGRLGWALSFNNFFIGLSIVNALLLALNVWWVKPLKAETQNFTSLQNKIRFFVLLFISFWLVSILLRMVFYIPNTVPQDTDLGHHMYWSELMVQRESFPVYTTPEVIEGEHMIFAVMSKLSGITLLSAMPLIILSFYNLAMILALPFTSLVITANKKVALWVLFLSGIYFAIDPPQARYVKGGVIGNTFGNLFIPLVFLLVFIFFRYFYQKFVNKQEAVARSYKAITSIISLIMVIIAGSFYTHHLSTFLLGITLAVSLVVWIIATFILNSSNNITMWDTIKLLLGFFRRIIFSIKFILTFLVVIFFPLFVYIPFYLRSSAISTVARAPEKNTHLGVPFTDLPGKLGWLRFILLFLGVIYLLIVLIIRTSKRYSILKSISSNKYVKYLNTKQSLYITLLFFGWFIPLSILTLFPGMLKVDLPSRRVINYLIFPSIILAAFAFNIAYAWMKEKYHGKLAIVIFSLLGLVFLWDGTSDFRSVFTGQNKFQNTVELYNASNYLAEHTNNDAVILKDHRTISGDSWIKFFLLRGYDYFLSRTYDYKYNDASNNLDPCTREMIIVPGSSVSQNCYGQTRINYVIVKPAGDEFLFWKGQVFNAVYLNDDIAIFKVTK